MAVVSWLSNDNEVTKKKIRDDNIAPIELNALSASKTYTVGKPFVLDSDGKLYKATQQIDQGSAIITSGENANCEEVTNGAEGIFGTKQDILNLNSSVGNLASRVGRAEGNITTLNEIKANTSDLGTASAKNAISVVTDSSDLVESGAVYDAIKGDGTLLKDTIGWSGKQLMPPSINNIYTHLIGRNLTGQNNLDGTLTINGTCNGNSEIVWFPRWLATQNLYLPIGKYVYNINRDDINLYIGTTYNGSYKAISDSSLGSVEFEITSDTQSDYKLADGSVLCAVYINILNGTVLNNEVLYPMIRKADIVDPTYEPYHASVEETLRDAEVIEGKNLIGWKIWYVYSSTDGSLSPNTHGVCSDKIKVISGQKFIGSKKDTLGSNDSMYARTYDANGDFVGTITVLTNTQLRNEITIPANIGYIGVFQLRNSADVSREWLDSNEIMFYDASETDPTYEPYYIPLKDVVPTKADNSVIAPVENGTTASKDYAIGDYFIKDTILGKTKAAIASGGTFTKDTNYEETNVAKELTELYKYIGILTTPVEAFTANSLPILKRNITNAFYNGSLRAEIAAGNFKNVRPGDYIIGQATGSIYYVVECDYWLGNGDSTNGTTYPAYNTHHLGLMLFKPVGTTALWRGYGYSDKSWRVSASDLGRCPWNTDITVDPTDTEAIGSNSTNITRSYNGTNMSAYMGSFIRERIDAILLPQCFQADFGSENVLKRRNWLSNAINASAASGARSDWQGIASGSVWVDRFIDLPSEVELYGSIINSSSRDDVGIQNKQLPIFRNGRIHDFYPRMDVWTKAVASSSRACSRYGNGYAVADYASYAFWASPLACVR